MTLCRSCRDPASPCSPDPTHPPPTVLLPVSPPPGGHLFPVPNVGGARPPLCLPQHTQVGTQCGAAALQAHPSAGRPRLELGPSSEPCAAAASLTQASSLTRKQRGHWGQRLDARHIPARDQMGWGTAPFTRPFKGTSLTAKPKLYLTSLNNLHPAKHHQTRLQATQEAHWDSAPVPEPAHASGLSLALHPTCRRLRVVPH